MTKIILSTLIFLSSTTQAHAWGNFDGVFNKTKLLSFCGDYQEAESKIADELRKDSPNGRYDAREFELAWRQHVEETGCHKETLEMYDGVDPQSSLPSHEDCSYEGIVKMFFGNQNLKAFNANRTQMDMIYEFREYACYPNDINSDWDV